MKTDAQEGASLEIPVEVKQALVLNELLVEMRHSRFIEALGWANRLQDACDKICRDLATVRAEKDELRSDFDSFQEHHAATEASLRAMEQERDELKEELEKRKA